MDLSDLGLLVGQKIIVRQALKRLQVSETNTDPSPSVSLTTSTAPMDELAGLRDFSEELKRIEAEVTLPGIPAGSKSPQPVSPVQGDNPSKEGKQSLLPSERIYGPDGKQLKPMQLSYSEFVLGNIKILESLFLSGNTKEAMEYLTYVKYLNIKGARFQTKSILAFDQEYRATKAREDFPWGANVDDLSSQYFDASVSHRAWQRQPRERGDRDSGRNVTTDEVCLRWNFSPNGCLNPSSCRYKHACISCSSTRHRGKSCSSGSRANSESPPKLLIRDNNGSLSSSSVESRNLPFATTNKGSLSSISQESRNHHFANTNKGTLSSIPHESRSHQFATMNNGSLSSAPHESRNHYFANTNEASLSSTSCESRNHQFLANNNGSLFPFISPPNSLSICNADTPLHDCPLNLPAWEKELIGDPDRDFILDDLRFGFKLIPESDPSFIADYEVDNYSSARVQVFVESRGSRVKCRGSRVKCRGWRVKCRRFKNVVYIQSLVKKPEFLGRFCIIACFHFCIRLNTFM